MADYSEALVEKRVQAIAPPQGSFVRNFMAHTYSVTDAPLIYSLGVAITVLSTLLDSDASFPYAGPLYGHSWCLLVGESGRSRKTAVVKKGVRLIKAIDAGKIIPSPESEAGLLESLAVLQDPSLPNSSAQAILDYGEFGSFLSGTTKGSYKASVRERLMDIWDGSTQTRRTVREELIVHNPRLSMLAGCAPSLLETHTTINDWQGGFISRFMILAGKRERIFTLPSTNINEAAEETRLIQQLSRFVNRPYGKVLGFTARARKYWDKWYTENENRFNHNSTQVAGLSSRVPVVALKTALVYGADFGPALQGQPWRIDLDVLEPACHVADLHAYSSLLVVSEMALTSFGRQRRSVLRQLGTNHRWYSFADLLRQLAAEGLAMSQRDLKTVLTTLQSEGTIDAVTLPTVGPSYRVHDDKHV
jgi:hypothetical protein